MLIRPLDVLLPLPSLLVISVVAVGWRASALAITLAVAMVNVPTVARLRDLQPQQAHAEAVATLAHLGVSAITAARPPSRLSGGELQRAALARAVLAHPDVLICDEITTALDDHGTALIVELLTELKDRGTALIWIGHDLGLVAAVADQVLVLDAGRVVEQGRPATVMTQPRSELTRRLVRAARLGHPQAPPVLIPDPRSEPRR